VEQDLTEWVCATCTACLDIVASAQVPTPRLPLLEPRGALYTLGGKIRCWNNHQHGEDGGRASVDGLAPFCGGDERLQCRLLAPERVLLERGMARPGFKAGL